MLLAMVEELGRGGSLLWDDQSWGFPILAGDDENGGGKILMDDVFAAGESADCCQNTVIKDVEAPPAPVLPPPAAGGKKRRVASTAAAVAKSKSVGGDEGSGGKGGGGGAGGGECDDHEMHIWTERERRKKMRDMFANLHSLIPHLPPRADKSTIVDEAVLYIKKLQLTLESLEKQKSEKLKGKTIATNPTACHPSTITHQNLAIQSRDGIFLAGGHGSASKRAVTLANPNPPPLFSAGPELFPAVFKTWTSPNVVMSVCGKIAHINVCCSKKPGLLTAIVFVLGKYKIEVVSAQVSSDQNRRMYMIQTHANGAPDQFPEAVFMVEEIYKLAAAEIMLWVNS